MLPPISFTRCNWAQHGAEYPFDANVGGVERLNLGDLGGWLGGRKRLVHQGKCPVARRPRRRGGAGAYTADEARLVESDMTWRMILYRPDLRKTFLHNMVFPKAVAESIATWYGPECSHIYGYDFGDLTLTRHDIL